MICLIYNYIENFESGVINIPGINIDKGFIRSTARYIDSVDGDDGIVDNKCTRCLSYFVDQSVNKGVTITFLPNELGGTLPNYAGLVWTDGQGLTRFKGYDQSGNLIADSGYVNIADSSFYQTFDEDHFFGFEYTLGISKIYIESTQNSLEIDHIQFSFK